MSEEHVSDWRSEHVRSAQRADVRPRTRASAAGGSLPPDGGGGRGVGASSDCLGVLRPFNPISWFHPRGIFRVLDRLLPRLPDVSGRLFLTFTVNPHLYSDPSTAFEDSRQLLRRIFHKLRKGVDWDGTVYRIDAPYCVKVEFHRSGWAHFHVIFMTRRFLPGDFLNHLWGLGRTNVQRISNEKFHYLLKYVTKGGGLPDWVKRRSRLRVFQASRGFYKPDPNAKPSRAKSGCPRKRKPSDENLGQRIERYQRTALFQNRKQFTQLPLKAPFDELHGVLLLPAAMDGRYLGNGHYQINDTTNLELWIKPSNQLNR